MIQIVILVVLFAAMWFFMIRPQQRRAAEQRAMRSAAAPGAEVMLTAGIYGTVVERTDDHVLVRIADGVEIRVVPAAIGTIIEPGEEPEIEESGEPGATVSLDKPADAPETGAAPAAPSLPTHEEH